MRKDTDAPHTLDAQLTEAAELAHVMGPEDRDRVERTVQIVQGALLLTSRAREQVESGRRLTDEAYANMVRCQAELANVLAELRVKRNNTSK